jgi:uncharacterized protein
VSIHTESIDLPGIAPGSAHRLIAHTFDGGRTQRSAYIQAGLHADEHPGLLAIQHLLRRLVELERDGRVLGRIVVRPFANPVGMGQKVFGMPTGRFNLENGENFNRHFPSVADEVREALRERDFARNDTAAFKSLFASLLEDRHAYDPVAATKLHLLRETLRHDILLDLHCDTHATLHLYSNRAQTQRATRLAAAMHIETVFLEDVAGGGPLDESYAQPWRVLHEAGLVDESHQGFCASIELRGQADVNDELAARDVRGILRFLAAEGLVEWNGREADEPVPPRVYPLEGASHVPSPATGIVAYRKDIGDTVKRGELIAEIVPLDGALDATRVPVHSDVDGVIVVQQLFKLVRAGQRIALLAGTESLVHRKAGQLLQDF